MKYLVWIFIVVSLLASCGEKKTPDVSGIKVNLELQRFDQDFFAMDTSNIDKSLQILHEKYPVFLQDFLFNILALPPQPDSIKILERQLKLFRQSYASLHDLADKVFADMTDVQQEVTRGLQFVKYYFPDYKLPSKLTTFIGPIDSYGNIITTDALGVGLQLYMGSSYSLYRDAGVLEQYPAYISRRFDKKYIALNCIKTVVDDLFPDNTVGRPLIEQMVQSGKRLYLLDHLLPETADTVKTGYTKKQLDGCRANESTIWSYFVQSDLLFSTDPSLTRDYMNEAPKTEAFGQDSPGLIGQFVGWQIVKKWMNKNGSTTVAEMMKTKAKTIFDGTKYKP